MVLCWWTSVTASNGINWIMFVNRDRHNHGWDRRRDLTPLTKNPQQFPVAADSRYRHTPKLLRSWNFSQCCVECVYYPISCHCSFLLPLLTCWYLFIMPSLVPFSKTCQSSQLHLSLSSLKNMAGMHLPVWCACLAAFCFMKEDLEQPHTHYYCYSPLYSTILITSLPVYCCVLLEWEGCGLNREQSLCSEPGNIWHLPFIPGEPPPTTTHYPCPSYTFTKH